MNPQVTAVQLAMSGSLINNTTASSSEKLGLYDASAPGVLLASTTLTGTASGTFNMVPGTQWVIPYSSSKTLLVKVLSAPSPSFTTSTTGGTGSYQILLDGVTWEDGATTTAITSLSPSIAIPVPSTNITGLTN